MGAFENDNGLPYLIASYIVFSVCDHYFMYYKGISMKEAYIIKYIYCLVKVHYLGTKFSYYYYSCICLIFQVNAVHFQYSSSQMFSNLFFSFVHMNILEQLQL